MRLRNYHREDFDKKTLTWLNRALMGQFILLAAIVTAYVLWEVFK